MEMHCRFLTYYRILVLNYNYWRGPCLGKREGSYNENVFLNNVSVNLVNEKVVGVVITLTKETSETLEM